MPFILYVGLGLRASPSVIDVNGFAALAISYRNYGDVYGHTHAAKLLPNGYSGAITSSAPLSEIRYNTHIIFPVFSYLSHLTPDS